MKLPIFTAYSPLAISPRIYKLFLYLHNKDSNLHLTQRNSLLYYLF
nr:MAG TPA: hypothetical protein [Caudoviricetes sp.]DAW23941.1 MAG TPA: hypothetical protein [Caudoviricetes sp.]